MSRAGFYEDGSFVPSQSQKQSPMSWRKTGLSSLDLRYPAHLIEMIYECWSREAWSKMSAVFPHLPPDQYGYTRTRDPIFRVAIATYIGQPCPLTMQPVVGRFFGKKEQQLDKYGADLTAASLSGQQGHSVLHNQLQSETSSNDETWSHIHSSELGGRSRELLTQQGW